MHRLAATITALGLTLAPLAAGAQAQNYGRKDFVGLPRPYVETIAKGEAAFATKDWVAATAAFEDATKQQPSKTLAFYRLGEAQRAAGKLDEADATWQAALGKQGPDDLEAKVMFVVADLRERQGKWEAAKTAWQGYLTFVTGHKAAHGFAASASERIKQIERRIKDEKDYGAVKERAAQREQEKAKEAEENAKKDKLNR